MGSSTRGGVGPRIPVPRHHRDQFARLRPGIEVAHQKPGPLPRRPWQQRRDFTNTTGLVLPVRREVRHDHRHIGHRRDADGQPHPPVGQAHGTRGDDTFGGKERDAFSLDAVSLAALQTAPVLGDPRLRVRVRPRAASTPPQSLRDQRGLVVAIESGVIPQHLLHTHKVRVEKFNRFDRLLEVVAPRSIRPLVNVERGDAKCPGRTGLGAARWPDAPTRTAGTTTRSITQSLRMTG